MFEELLKSALVLFVSFAVKWLFGVLGVEIDADTFNAIVAAIVAYFLGLFGVAAARKAAPKLF